MYSSLNPTVFLRVRRILLTAFLPIGLTALVLHRAAADHVQLAFLAGTSLAFHCDLAVSPMLLATPHPRQLCWVISQYSSLSNSGPALQAHASSRPLQRQHSEEPQVLDTSPAPQALSCSRCSCSPTFPHSLIPIRRPEHHGVDRHRIFVLRNSGLSAPVPSTRSVATSSSVSCSLPTPTSWT